jgi:hypothetical protein
VMVGDVPVIGSVVPVMISGVPGVVLVVKRTVAIPLAFVVLVGVANEPPPKLLHVTILPAMPTGLLFTSASCAVIVIVLPAGGFVLLVVMMYFAGGPATVATLALVPPWLLASAPVKLYVTPATVPVVKSTVATPFVFVAAVADANEPPAPVLPHVTTTPLGATELPFTSASCAEIVTTVPATADVLLGVTMYFAAGPTIVVMSVVPVRLPVVALTKCSTFAVVLVVKTTVATPLADVVLVGLPNDPPLVLLHVTTVPAVGTGFPSTSTSCAEMVTAEPAIGLDLVDVTTYRVGFPTVVIGPDEPVTAPVVAVTT